MDIPRPDGPDVNRGSSAIVACWTLTGIVFFLLLFRFAVKTWISFLLPNVSKPQRVWGYEDCFFALGYAFDVGHTSMILKSYEWGLGRHFFYLTPIEKNLSIKWDFISQPLGVAAAMWSRTGVIIFLYTCFAQNKKRLRVIVLTCLIVQIVANLFTILQIFLQCGPNPYRLVNRAAYFHYMWDPLPADDSVRCMKPTVQATIGYVQGAINSMIDFILTYLAGFELWQFMIRTESRGRQIFSLERFKRMDRSLRSQRLWQTVLLCGPLLLSGVASIVKTYLLSALGSRLDFTWNIVPFVIWVKIENYCIPIATTAPIIRLFIRTFVEQRRNNGTYGMSGSGEGHSKTDKRDVELADHSSHNRSNGKSFSNMASRDEISDEFSRRSREGSENDLVDDNGIMITQEYEVRVEIRNRP